jgi:hypothetical protein
MINMGQVFKIIYYFNGDEHRLNEVENQFAFDDEKIIVRKMVRS